MYQHNEIIVERHKATSDWEKSLTPNKIPTWLNLSITYNEQYSVCKAGISGCCREVPVWASRQINLLLCQSESRSGCSKKKEKKRKVQPCCNEIPVKKCPYLAENVK